MKLNSTLTRENVFVILMTMCFTFVFQVATAQISTVCTDPTNFIYGLSGSGEIREINVNTGASGTLVKN
ncbi:MAG: hypothetical protein SFU20_05535, partial [Chitinophagaceae bacterium]|nr:hypothetical protein [Chitinophagaceae bacterium]